MKLVKVCILIIVIGISCKKPYNPPATSTPNSYLVVEGVINAGADSTVIKLSRTVNLAAGITTNPVTDAILTIQSNTNGRYPLAETANGTYTVANLNLDVALQYRLSIKTTDNQQYFSDFEAVNVTPPIDSIGFKITSNGLQIYANTHDPDNKTHYYRWDYSETWQFHAEYESQYISNGKALVFRSAAQQIYYCFASDLSSDIVLGSSAKLQQDVIYQNPIVFIPSTSEKLEIKYSILLKEYALSSQAYNFWQNLKTNTENLGSIFDALPSTISGNIHNANNPSQTVIGYISVCSVQLKRIFISNSQLPTWSTTYPYGCTIDTAKGIQIVENLIDLPPKAVTLDPALLGMTFEGYLASGTECADCTIRGIVTPPSFWK